MKALSLHQPWASLIAEGMKTIETRPWATKYRGPLAIHAVKKVPGYSGIGNYLVEPWFENVRHLDDCYCEADGITPECSRRAERRMVLSRQDGRGVVALPLGAIVATATLVDVVPIVAIEDERASGAILDVARDRLLLWRSPLDPQDVSDQRPYDDFTPGRWAWLLADVVKLPDPIPCRGRQGLWEWREA